jgi:hypothetical protein
MIDRDPFDDGAGTNVGERSSAEAALDPALLDEIERAADKAASYWRSLAEASFRGDVMTVAVHLRQVRLVTFHVHEIVKQFGGSQEARAA